jgi:hypothetical protein
VEILPSSGGPTLFDRICHLAGKTGHLPPDAAEQQDALTIDRDFEQTGFRALLRHEPSSA